ncbi:MULTISPECIES: hypothetical protein [Actinomycetes]|uniref:hypothetical protein n=1 Tax=Actinomycetes TaxID=1760 RepID=UPI0031F8F65E
MRAERGRTARLSCGRRPVAVWSVVLFSPRGLATPLAALIAGRAPGGVVRLGP